MDSNQPSGTAGGSAQSSQAAAGAGAGAQQTAAAAMDQAKQAAASAVDQAKQTTGPAADKVQQTAGQVAEQAKQQAATQIDQGKSQAADNLTSVAQALRQTGDQLRQQETSVPVAQLVQSAAERLERFSTYLRQTDAQEIAQDVEQFARRQPAAFIGGAFTLGVLAARFFKSSTAGSAAQSTALARRYDDAGYSGSAGTPYSRATYGQGRYSTAQGYSPSSASSGSAVGGSFGSSSTSMAGGASRSGMPTGLATGGAGGVSSSGGTESSPLDVGRDEADTTISGGGGSTGSAGWGHPPGRGTSPDREG